MAGTRDRKAAIALGQAIMTRRQRKGMTQLDLAERLGIEQHSVSRMEKGIISPKISRLPPASGRRISAVSWRNFPRKCRKLWWSLWKTRCPDSKNSKSAGAEPKIGKPRPFFKCRDGRFGHENGLCRSTL